MDNASQMETSILRLAGSGRIILLTEETKMRCEDHEDKGRTRDKRVNIDICRCVNMSLDRAERPVEQLRCSAVIPRAHRQ
jgi:hypothetical protein